MIVSLYLTRTYGDFLMDKGVEIRYNGSRRKLFPSKDLGRVL